jgi:hypothetical protein
MYYAVISSDAIVGGTAMTQPLGNCPECGGDESFEQAHANDLCPDTGGECPEWACPTCGAGVFMGIMIIGTPPPVAGDASITPARQSVRAA